MNEKHLLAVFFNEDYSKNIPILERIYAKRFPHRLYIVPDHHARFEAGYRAHDVDYRSVNRRDRVFSKTRRLVGRRNRHELRDASIESPLVRVTGFKYYFQDYFWQARRALLAQSADWYWFMADDLLLNPKISAGNILKFFSVPSETTRTILCEPYYRSDIWVNYFQSDYNKTVDDLASIDAYAPNYGKHGFSDDPHKSGPNQRRIIAGCADFFGCHSSVLEQALMAFHSLAQQKVFVEIAVPNVMLSIDKAARMTHDYAWEFDTGRGNVERIRNYLEFTPERSAFYHPVKLGILAPGFVDQVVLTGTQR